MTVKEMVKQQLAENGQTGLWSWDCGCNLDHLMSCNEVRHDCEAGYACYCGKCTDTTCEIYAEAKAGGHDYVVRPEKCRNTVR